MSESTEPWRALVVGAGAVGAFYGGKLAAAGAAVSVVARSDHDEVARDGYAITSPLGDFRFRPQAVYRRAEDAPPPDVLLVALKVLPSLDTAAIIRPVVGPQTTIVLLQNGVEIEPPLAAAFPANDILSGLAFVCINRLGPARIHHLDYGDLSLGRFPGGVGPVAERLAAHWRAGGINVTLSDDIVTARWRKLVWNAAFNSISVAGGGVSTRQVLDTPVARRLVRRVMDEVLAIAAATGHPLPADTPAHMIALSDNMRPYKTSMLLDHEAGRPMELEAILGNALRAARRHDVDAPSIAALHALLTLADEARP